MEYKLLEKNNIEGSLINYDPLVKQGHKDEDRGWNLGYSTETI